MRTWLRDIRRIKGMTEKSVASQVGISQVAYHYIEHGQRNPTPDVAQRIADVMGFDWTLFYPRSTDDRDRKRA